MLPPAGDLVPKHLCGRVGNCQGNIIKRKETMVDLRLFIRSWKVVGHGIELHKEERKGMRGRKDRKKEVGLMDHRT